MQHTPPRQLILASTSVYRQQLLARLRLPFTVFASQVDEIPLGHESPQQMACRLALAKAQAVAALHPEAVVIGSDQVADLDGVPLGKPGHHARALAQWQTMLSKTGVFQTAVAVVCRATRVAQTDLARFNVKLRNLSVPQI